ncbi:N-acetyltransferase [Paenibacillus marchantiophytorum]|uniref:N-acetyltransferase n=1 Tax=Paenibacillus marchantiophytorum TaxID=1619310 RepID=A0ABQ2BS77_9BACL|nr:GNAT family N-acetyltransferase [Paenibacillus marchantiophytorum]GGI43708.1 N-acetyltransferase [Paenibacillus marchantiophytorum]
MSEVYRLATIDDAEEQFQVIHRAYASIRELGITFLAANADIDLIKDNLLNNTNYVLEIDGSIAATLSLKNLPELTELPFLYWFAVSPAYKNQGIGNRLLAYVEEVIVRDTLLADGVVLATSQNHPWLLTMYQRKGYEAFFQRPLGDSDTLIFLKKKLLKQASLAQ